MTTIESIRDMADLAQELARLPDDVQVSAATAALLVCVDDPPSQRTMERWRQGRNQSGETGPPFTSGPGRTSAVSYNVGALRSWLLSRQATTTMDVSTRRGLSFTALSDAMRMQPWVVADGLVVDHLLRVPDEMFSAALRGEAELELLIASLSYVMTEETWSDAMARAPFQGGFESLLEALKQGSRARQSAQLLDVTTPKAPEPLDDTCPRCGKAWHDGRSCRI